MQPSKCTSKRARQTVQRRSEVKREAATGNSILQTQGIWKRIGWRLSQVNRAKWIQAKIAEDHKVRHRLSVLVRHRAGYWDPAWGNKTDPGAAIQDSFPESTSLNREINHAWAQKHLWTLKQSCQFHFFYVIHKFFLCFSITYKINLRGIRNAECGRRNYETKIFLFY